MSSYISDPGPNYRGVLHSWGDVTHQRLWWHYGPERALSIHKGTDHDTNIDLAKWRALGRKSQCGA